jgi:acyl-CoA synthetase (AMP-forming)/AMP-acid ligase II
MSPSSDRPNDSLASLLRERAEGQPDKVAYTFLADGAVETSVTYGELARQARSIGASLLSRMSRGDRAVLLYPTGPEFASAFWACICTGIVAVPVPEPVQDRHVVRVKNIVADAGARIVLTSSRLLDMIRSRIGDLEGIDWIATDSIDAAVQDRWPAAAPGGDDIAFLQYTSGSTGRPRGVIVSHRNLLANCEMIRQFFDADASAVSVSWLPLFHDMGLIAKMIETVYLGGRSILMSPFSFLRKPIRWLQAISQFKAEISGAPDFAYALCARRLTPEQCDGLDLSSWRVAFNGAEPIRPRTLRAFVDRFSPFGFHAEALRPCYGLAEATLLVSGEPRQRAPRLAELDVTAFERRKVAPKSSGPIVTSVSCGPIAYEGQTVRIVDPETLVECADGVGEIWVAGRHVARGYWNNAEDTTATFGGRITGRDEGPFLRTGDLGFLHDGELHIAGRIKDLIIVDGTNHYPQDIEQTVEDGHPAVRKGCVVAFSVQREGEEEVVVLAELHDNNAAPSSADHLAIAEAIRGAVSAQHGVRLADVRLVKPGTIQKTSSGKLERRACRAGYLANSLPVFV